MELSEAEYNRSSGEQIVLRFYDFFAGAGLVRLALNDAWKCVWANDIDARKANIYRANFPNDFFVCKDIAHVDAAELPDGADMAWASFPCQDLSLAGWRHGLSGERSGTFWQFWRVMQERCERGKRPPLIVIENVLGLLYGDSFAGLSEAIAALGMQFGAVVMDARPFLPQSRQRVFVIAADAGLKTERFCTAISNPVWSPPALTRAVANLPGALQNLWRWWRLPVPKEKIDPISIIVETKPKLVDWHTPKETEYILSLMNETHAKRINTVRQLKGRHVGFLYKRIRQGKQRAEIRFDGVSGCLRTPQGGSSRQTVVIVEDGEVRSRLLSPREAARLMGVPDTFILPDKYNDAYKAMGDGVAVPVVRWLSEHLLRPLAAFSRGKTSAVPDHSNLASSFRNSQRRAAEWSTMNGKPEDRRDLA